MLATMVAYPVLVRMAKRDLDEVVARRDSGGYSPKHAVISHQG